MTVEIKEDEGMKDKGEVEGNRIERLRAAKNEGPDSEAGAGSQLSAEGSTATSQGQHGFSVLWGRKLGTLLGLMNSVP